MDPFDLERITRALASASLDRTKWGAAAQIVAERTKSYGMVLLPVVGSLPLVCVTTSMEKTFDLYVQGGWLEHDERYRATARFLKNGVATDDDVAPKELRKRSPFYQDFLGRCGLSEWAGVRAGRGERVWCLSLQRTPEQGPFSKEELTCLARLSNSLDSIVEVSCALGTAQGEAALQAFQFSDRAALLLNRAGEVVCANGAADDLVGTDLMISHGRIRSSDHKATELLNQAIRTLLWSRTSSLVPPVVFPKADRGKLAIYPMRLRGLTDSPLSAFHAILVIVDTHAQRSLLNTTLHTLFNLTQAEARLAIAIANGKDIASFAAGVGVSKETARNQLKAVFDKTGTRRQSELVSMLATLIPKR